MVDKAALMGQNPGSYQRMVVANDSAILFDLGGTYLRSACLSPGRVITDINQERIRSFRDGLSFAEIWSEVSEKMVVCAKRLETRVEKTAPLVISFPGPLHEDGKIINAPTVSGIDDNIPDLRAELYSCTGRAVHILNDVSAAALYLARNTDWNRLMVVTVSSGIGSKVCIRNSGNLALFDKGAYAGEIGHLTVDQSKDAPRCDCGGQGHLGAIASGRGIEQLARQRAIADAAAFAQSGCHSRFGATALTLNNEEHFVPAVHAGDEWSIGILREGSQPLAFVLNAIIFALGLQGVFIIGGFAFSLGEIYLAILREMIRSRSSYSAFHFSPEMIRFGDLSEEACLRGAAEYALMVRNSRA
jgi:predicted NBD/HSP70 family sugar kinase